MNNLRVKFRMSFTMYVKEYQLIGLAGLLMCYSCVQQEVQYEATTFDFPKPVPTESREIHHQEKGIFGDAIHNVFVRNDFDGARLNGFEWLNDSMCQVTILPENEPINPSAWYAFKVWAEKSQSIGLRLHYPTSRHRYFPKWSVDGTSWQPVDSSQVSYPDSTDALVQLSLTAGDTLWLAAQEIIDSHRVLQWCQELAKDKAVHVSFLGQSKLGRPLIFMDLQIGDPEGKEVIVVMSRQHPPEVTGYMAMQAFVEEMLRNSRREAFFERYRILVYPLLNPDGVDLGHWRHNAGGVDLNRDWAYYHQPETKQIADHIVAMTSSTKEEVIIGLDFHSTYHDVYYTMLEETCPSKIPTFRNRWFGRIESLVGNGYEVNESAAGLGSPVSKGWFYTQFNGAEGITYEIGDHTPRDFIQKKGRASAQALMEVLLSENDR